MRVDRMTTSSFIGTCVLTLAVITMPYSARAGDGPVAIKVTNQALCDGEISPLQYGQFVEYLADLVPGMWGEKLDDGGFEGLTPYTFVYLKETDFKVKSWYPSGATNRATFEIDKDVKVSGEGAKRIWVADAPPAVVGVSQDGIHVRDGEGLSMSCWLRGKDLKGKVRIKLHREEKIFAESEFEVSDQWRKFDAKWTPGKVDDATLTVEFRGPGTVWLDDVSLMSDDTVGGWRKDVVSAVHDLKPGVIRFGGSALDAEGYGNFEWKDVIGPVEKRKTLRAWGGLQPRGAGLEEFVQFCRAAEAEPLICVRFNKRTAKDAADQVEYFNGSTDTPMGKWRQDNGHANPYRVKYWQVGNEVASAEYETHLAEFAQAMKKVDPSIEILSSFPTAGILKNAGKDIHYLSPHHYTRDLDGMQRDFINLKKMIQEHGPADRRIKIAVTEWNVTAGDPGPARAMLWNLDNALACSRYHNLMHRHADVVTIANRSNLCNSFCSGIIQTDRKGRLYKTPTYYAQQLYGTMAGTKPLKTQLASGTGLDISATVSGDGKTATLFVVNPTLNIVRLDLDVTSFGKVAEDVTVKTLSDREKAGEPDVTNSFSNPERVRVRDSTQKSGEGKIECQVEPLSLTVLRWTVVK
jgi:alpha-N-arabinofuranosidase